MDDKTRIELEAATFRRLVEHLRERTDVQNIDLMNLAGFCRNCLSKWYRAEAEIPEGSHRRAEGRLRRFAAALIVERAAAIVAPAAGGRRQIGERGSCRMSGASRARS